jgi:hypothetical protein
VGDVVFSARDFVTRIADASARFACPPPAVTHPGVEWVLANYTITPTDEGAPLAIDHICSVATIFAAWADITHTSLRRPCTCTFNTVTWRGTWSKSPFSPHIDFELHRCLQGNRLLLRVFPTNRKSAKYACFTAEALEAALGGALAHEARLALNRIERASTLSARKQTMAPEERGYPPPPGEIEQLDAVVRAQFAAMKRAGTALAAGTAGANIDAIPTAPARRAPAHVAAAPSLAACLVVVAAGVHHTGAQSSSDASDDDSDWSIE